MSKLVSSLTLVLTLSVIAASTSVCVFDASAAKPGKRKYRDYLPKVSAPPEVPLPSGERLRILAPVRRSAPILIGAASNASNWGTESETILNREFGYVTPGNDFKQSLIHPEPDAWRWAKSDDWVRRCKENKQIMRLHGPISPQCSKWALADDRTAEELEQNLREFMTELCKRYNNVKHIRWMDVVNETVTREGEWFGPREGIEKWENPWTKIGFDESDPLRPPLYIKQAFEIANRHAPRIKQLINQHGDMEQVMWRKVAATVVYLRKAGLRVDGIGWQAHVDAGFEKDPDNIKNLHAMIDWAHRNELEFHVTENTVWLKGDMAGDHKAQAETYQAILQTLIEHRDTGVVTWNAWQIRDNETQNPEREGCLFDAAGNAKPAYFAIQKQLSVLAK